MLEYMSKWIAGRMPEGMADQISEYIAEPMPDKTREIKCQRICQVNAR